jgi:hypothetical protein
MQNCLSFFFETNGRSSASQLRKEKKSFMYRSQNKGKEKQRRKKTVGRRKTSTASTSDC